MSTELEKRIEKLEDIEAIKQLKNKYCRLADAAIGGDAAKWDELLSHFTENVTAEFAGMGQFEGRDSVGQVFKETVPQVLSYTSHMVLNPIIEVDGETAKGSWYFFVPCTVAGVNKAAWAQGIYEDEFIKIDGRWMWKHLSSTYTFLTPIEDGWVKTPMLGA